MLATKKLGAVVVVACATASCQSILSVDDVSKLRAHVVSSDAEGRALDPATGDRKYDLAPAVTQMLRQADEAAQKRQIHVDDPQCGVPGHEHPPSGRVVRRLLVHVHGGMNSGEASRARAVDTLRRIEFEKGADWSYPIFLTWPSGGFDSLGEHLFELRFGSHLNPSLGYPVSPVVIANDLLQGVARSPNTVLTMLANDAQVGARVALDWDFLPTFERGTSVREVTAHPTAHVDAHTEDCAKGIRVGLGGYSRGAGTQAWRLLRYIVLFPVKFVTTPLFVDGFGKEAWRVMLHRASNTLRPTTEFEAVLMGESEPSQVRDALGKPASGVFAVFFAELDRFAKRAPSDVCWEITLIGHSMGTIVLNDVLQLFPDLPVRNVVYMAAACSIAEAEEALVPYLERHPASQFHMLTLHPIAEADEVVAWDLPSRGSLLEWIDLWFQSPDHPLDRRLGKWNNAASALHVFARVSDQVSLKGFAVDGDSKPQAHGEFDEGPFWRRAIWEVGGPDHY